jgi:hypothetical protein
VDSVQPNPHVPAAAQKAQRLRRISLVRGRHTWTFLCAPGEEAHLLREAHAMADAAGPHFRRLDLLILARELGIDLESLKHPVRKAE